NQAQTINISSFDPTWTSQIGADVFQVEISTDRTFSNPSRIFRIGPIFSTAPNAAGVTQRLPSTVNLTTATELLNDTAFANFVTNAATTNPPQLFWRVGARHDSDQPGPVNWVSRNPKDADRTFRFVYSPVQSFTPAPGPPAPPGTPGSRAAAILNRKGATRAAGTPLPLPGDSPAGRLFGQKRALTLRDLLLGPRGGRR
ncbi:MAG TPA: hypothetical protein VFB38_01255, partial [Chthonomonadaceae bacterium]|nr:hypothetical protein [Chthonomonadaceae bacterium]